MTQFTLCRDCVFSELIGDGYYACHRNPPQLDHSSRSNKGVFPIIGGYQFCGEGRPFLPTSTETK